MKEEIVSRGSLLVNALLYSSVGLILIFLPQQSQSFFHFLVSFLLCLVGFLSLCATLLKKKTTSIIKASTTLTLGLFLLFFPRVFFSFFGIIFAIYVLINALAEWITYLIWQKNRILGRLPIFLDALLDTIFGLLFLIKPLSNINTLTLLLGIYLLLIGLVHIYDLLKDFFPKMLDSTKRRYHISPPVVFLSFFPYNALTKINHFLNSKVTSVEVENKETSGEVDLEIYIHVKETGDGVFGHADLFFDGVLYSYGNYDNDSKRLWKSIGDGVLIEIKNKKKYIDYCITHSKKTLFGFGITLTEEQKKKVREQLRHLKESCIRWYSNVERGNPKGKDDYPSTLFEVAKAKCYKFQHGSFKTYFLLSTNCVKLVDYVVGAAGLDLLKMNGVITPGTYYNYLDTEFKRQNSNVIEKKIYHQKDKETSSTP